MTITAINKRKRQARYDIFLDGEYFATLSDQAILENRLKVGDEVDGAAFAELVKDAEKQDAVHYVLAALSARAYTEKGARDKLKDRGFSPEAIAYALERMAYYGYINDEEYCKDYIAECHNTRSNRRIKQDLWEKGIKDAVAEKYLKDNDEHDACMLSLTRKARGKEWTEEFVLKLTKYLLGQGYEYDVVKTCLGEYATRDED
ncbi:MAG: RecX family transcriptional regulator [Clostridia bacterium]|nr:RecX family transcriptional regulator [Clostridia bacterium]